MYQLKVAKDSNYLKHIPLIRKCFPELSIGEIKRRIESGEVVAEQDPIPRWDPLDDLRGIDRVQMFCDLRTALVGRGAKVTVLEDGKTISETLFQNSLELLKEIERQVEEDMDREAGE